MFLEALGIELLACRVVLEQSSDDIPATVIVAGFCE